MTAVKSEGSTLHRFPAASFFGRFRRLAAAITLAVVTSAHIGSPDTWFVGDAGPYPLRVLVRSPGVIPGLADVTIWAPAEGVRRIWATPAYFNAGERGLPPADTATAVDGRPGTYTVQLWIMIPGSYSVRVSVDGDQGTSTVIVPVSAVATEVRDMDPKLGVVLAGLGLFLLVGLVTIVGAATRESVLPPGEDADPRRRRRAIVAMGATAVAMAGVLWGGKVWWDAEDRAYRRGLDQQWRLETTLLGQATDARLRVKISDSVWLERRVTPLVPDHGKLMHLFMARDDGDAFAHLHPVSVDSSTFETTLPALPAGRYWVFADITHESGFARTMVGSVTVPDLQGSPGAPDPDDGWRVGPVAEGAASLSDGATISWEGRPDTLRVNEEAGLRFALREADGLPGSVEPYLGMAGHAVVMREDGSVFIHLHPMGTISAAAQVLLTEREASDTARGALGKRLTEAGAFTRHATHAMTLPGTFEFPYAFPDTGAYRVWVQVKRGGKIETAAFKAVVLK